MRTEKRADKKTLRVEHQTTDRIATDSVEGKTYFFQIRTGCTYDEKTDPSMPQKESCIRGQTEWWCVDNHVVERSKQVV